MLPLDGIRVLDLGISTAGPYSARFLGDLGAEVIKVEPIDGENARSLSLRFGNVGYLFHVNNYNKKSVTLNVQSEEGRAIFLDLVAISDVGGENFALGTMDKWGIGYEACRVANPSIIFCSAKGFGLSGPAAGKKAFDTVVQGMSGLMDLAGQPGEPPVKAGPSACDLMTAGANAFAVMAAIAARRESESQLLDTSLFDMGVLATLPFWPAAARDAEGPHSLGNGHPDHAPFGLYACRDGQLVVNVRTDAEWAPLADLIGMPAAWNRPMRLAHREEIETGLQQWLAAQDVWPAANRLQGFGIPAAPVLDVAQASRAQAEAGDPVLIDIDHPVYGPMPLIRTPLAAGVAGTAIRRLQPTLGQHNDEIIGELLGRRSELPELRSKGVVG